MVYACLAGVVASTAKLTVARRLAVKFALSPTSLSGVRHVHVGKKGEVHATESKGYSNDYIHAETMYNLTAMTGRKLKFGALVWGGVAVGIIVPLVACNFQQRKARGGAE